MKLYQLLKLSVILEQKGEVVADNAASAPAVEAAPKVEEVAAVETPRSSNANTSTYRSRRRQSTCNT